MPRSILSPNLIKALYRKDYKTLKRGLNKDTVNLPDEEGGLTLLMLAVSDDDADTEMVQFLIDQGSDVNLADSTHNYTALHFAARDLRSEIVRILLDAGAVVDPINELGNTPLGELVLAPDRKVFIALLLLNKGADPNRKVINGMSCKDWAKNESASLFACLKDSKWRRKGKSKKGSKTKG
jgi:ankyrin repeat protein